MNKLITLIWTLIFVLTISCNVNDFQDMDQPLIDENIEKLTMEDNATVLDRIMWNVGYTMGFTMSAELAKEKNLDAVKPGQGFPKLPKLSWQEVDEFYRKEFEKVIVGNGIISDEERKLTQNIQSLSLIILDKMAESNHDNSKNISERAAYYTKILYRHKAIDLNRMADALVLSKSGLEDSEFDEIKYYLIEKANRQTLLALERFNQYNQEYKTAIDKDEKRKWFNTLKRLQSMTDEAQYVRELLGDNKK